MKEGIAAGIDLSACNFEHVDRSNPDMMEASLKCIIRAEEDAKPGKAAHVASHLRMCSAYVHAHVHVYAILHLHLHATLAGKAKLVGELAKPSSSVQGLAELLASIKLSDYLGLGLG